MKLRFRFVITAISALSALYFVFWTGGAVLLAFHAPVSLSTPFALVVAAAVGQYVWNQTATVQSGLIDSIVRGAFTVGGLGFAGGFLGPILLAPDANQGPLLGIFITGPLGFILGAIGGAIYWVSWGRRRSPDFKATPRN
jgi:hypothetical protein